MFLFSPVDSENKRLDEEEKRDIKIRRESLHWQYVSLLWQVSFAGTGDLRCVWQSVCSLH